VNGLDSVWLVVVMACAMKSNTVCRHLPSDANQTKSD
jgi:hypothetical protein